MKKRTPWCRRCHVAGAEEKDEIMVVSMHRSAYDGALSARFRCEKCGHAWSTGYVNGIETIPGYKRAREQMEREEPIIRHGGFSRFRV